MNRLSFSNSEGGGCVPREEGFTLVELLVSILLLAVGLLGMVLANTYVQKTSESAYERMVATQDAHRVIEMIRNVSQTGSFPSNVTNAFPHGAAVPGFGNLSGETVVVRYADVTADPLNITVRTDWRAQGTRAVWTELQTLMTQRT